MGAMHVGPDPARLATSMHGLSLNDCLHRVRSLNATNEQSVESASQFVAYHPDQDPGRSVCEAEAQPNGIIPVFLGGSSIRETEGTFPRLRPGCRALGKGEMAGEPGSIAINSSVLLAEYFLMLFNARTIAILRATTLEVVFAL